MRKSCGKHKKKCLGGQYYGVGESSVYIQQDFQSDVLTILTTCLLYTSDAADEEDSVDLGGRRIIKKLYFFSSESEFSMKNVFF